ncbi:membrane-bound neuregulin protein vein isoform X4 [Lasioglossum baleicum]|uniref:membrane-bound neuregulin protein vein isoform X4 n=1 Tax=Lasioglossum baleicum TaxID=434251 RepID=UPI003FCE5AFD
MMWASLLLAGILSGWWGALALAAAPPANRNSLGETSTRTTAGEHPASMNIAAVLNNLDHRLTTWDLVTSAVAVVPGRDWPRDYQKSENDQQQTSSSSSTALEPFGKFGDQWNRGSSRINEELFDDSIRAAFVASSLRANRRLGNEPVGPSKTVETGLVQLPRHSSTQTPFLYTQDESSVERPRVVRSTKQRPKNRTKADSPREQRRRCRNKGCRGQNWCPDMDVGNRAYLAPTVFEGKARSMSSARKPGSNYAVTFEVKQVYKSQPGFPPLQKNDSVRLHFRDKSAPGKSTVCAYDNDGSQQQQQQQQQQQRDNQSGVVRANIKRGKVYLVFVNRVGPRNFTILGEPVIRSKKNEQAVQAVVRPDYGRVECFQGAEDGVAVSNVFLNRSIYFLLHQSLQSPRCILNLLSGGYVVRAQELDSQVTGESEAGVSNEGVSTPSRTLAERRHPPAPPQRTQDSAQTRRQPGRGRSSRARSPVTSA